MWCQLDRSVTTTLSTPSRRSAPRAAARHRHGAPGARHLRADPQGCLARIGAGGPETGRADGRAAEVLRACAVYFPRSAITYAPVAESIPFHIPSLYCMFQIAALKLGNWFVSILTGAAILENGLRETCADHIPTSRIPFRTLALRCGIDRVFLEGASACERRGTSLACEVPGLAGRGHHGVIDVTLMSPRRPGHGDLLVLQPGHRPIQALLQR